MLHDLGEGEMKRLFADMRTLCIKEGFDGLTIIGERRPGLNGIIDQMEDEKEAGLDAVYAYCNIYTPRSAANYIKTSAEAGVPAVTSFGTDGITAIGSITAVILASIILPLNLSTVFLCRNSKRSGTSSRRVKGYDPAR